MHADRIFVLEHGRITEAGSHSTLLDQKGLYYAMWRQQIGERRAVPGASPSVGSVGQRPERAVAARPAF